LLDKARDFLLFRTGAYRRVFNLESRDADVVLKDLAKFCRAHVTTFHTDARAHALAEGRREVFLRIQQHLNLPDDQLWKLFGERK